MRLVYIIPALGFCVALMASALSVDAKDKPYADKGCPPGLARKSPSCVPPGQAKKYNAPYRVGDRIPDGYLIVERPGRFGLDPSQTYFRVGDNIFRVNRETREVLDFIGAAAALLD